MLWMYQRVFFGPLTHDENKDLEDLNARELIYLLPIVVLCFWIGLYPKPFFRVMEKPVDYIVQAVDGDYRGAEATEAPMATAVHGSGAGAHAASSDGASVAEGEEIEDGDPVDESADEGGSGE